MQKKGGFSIIELMVVITIIGVISIGLLVPYNLYSNISKVKMSKETINQLLNEARNSAAGLTEFSTSKNQNTALIFKKGSNKVLFVAVPFDFSGSLFKTSEKKILREVFLDEKVFINSISSDKDTNTNMIETIIYFKSPDGEKDILLSDIHTGSYIKLTLGYGNTISGLLSKEIEIK